jgi:ribosomal protein L16/L10AE
MAHSFGRPISVAARVKAGQAVFAVHAAAQSKDVVREAMRRAASKLSGHYKTRLSYSSQKVALAG